MPEIAYETQIIDKPKIRKHFDVTTRKWYFSIVDVIDSLIKTKDSQNYWKVLKNRLKKRSPELVTKCNQLKMRAKDGKFYLTDVADSETIIHIIEATPRASVEAFKAIIAELEEIVEGKRLEVTGRTENTISPLLPDPSFLNSPSLPPLPSTLPIIEAEAELFVDAYQTEKNIFVQAMLAGVTPENLKVKVSNKKVLIYGERKKERGEVSQENYTKEELLWATFVRVIALPSPVSEEFKISGDDGLVTIELRKI